MFSPIISGKIFILSMSCVSGDEVQVAIHRYEDIFRWLKTLDHEGSHWDVTVHYYDPLGNEITDTEDITDKVVKEYK